MDNYVIGIDGGGTKTTVMVADPDGQILKSFAGDTINYNGGGKAFIDSNLQSIFHTIAANGYQPGQCASICIGTAGISNPLVKERLLENISRAGFTCPVKIVGDADTAFAGALDNGEGIILIAGTGSICLGKDHKGNSYRTGGFGHLIDDEGSGYWIARDILANVVKSCDGRIEPTILKELVFEYLAIHTVEELISYVYLPNRNKKEIAELSIVIEEAVKRKDHAAIKVVERCISGLTELVSPVIRRFQSTPVLAVAGSILLNNRKIYEGFAAKMKELHPEVSVIKPKNPAAYGAVLLALQQIEDHNFHTAN